LYPMHSLIEHFSSGLAQKVHTSLRSEKGRKEIEVCISAF